ncbi:Aspartate-semialdehyde dehydrogenase [Wickerhamiella sorbophila]|uniref:Aspartate-semialdehyde dehydrogenase n=1 Tax=Wickerhamiella sorbophila TaxID=45607 RepID=A0A2T0FER4_9ASCO|nr:Aspartate-semialdehyde dehydrogenase [Wickerhamiella sorbophila]PRT53481.1 Aspartate-semialdehyde dehydrogenase [Wickerhamiella sorbophila]
MAIKAGVLGATGSVGQRFILLLEENPEFELVALGASKRSSGRAYGDVVAWKQTKPIPAQSSGLTVHECSAVHFTSCDVVFSGLDSDVAGDIEEEFVNHGINVISNAKNYRQHPQVPLVVPTANPEHLDHLANHDKSKGIHICISNCSTAGLVVPLKALQEKFGPISHMMVTTMQAVSGAGFSPGVSSMDVLDNLVPYIGSEEDKLEMEPRKILGDVDASTGTFLHIPQDEFKISATTTRVAVIDGHTASVSIKFAKNKPSKEEIIATWREYQSQCELLKCKSAPEHAIVYLDQPDRPQPRLDRDTGNGYTVSCGRLRDDEVLDYKFVCLSHNTVLGAAGSGILIAELLKAKNII